jgi:hypothetical protein
LTAEASAAISKKGLGVEMSYTIESCALVKKFRAVDRFQTTTQ